MDQNQLLGTAGLIMSWSWDPGVEDDAELWALVAISPIPINNYCVVWGEVWTSIDVSMWRFLVFHHWFVVLPRLLRLAALLLPSFGLAVSASSGSAGNQLRTLTECDWDLTQMQQLWYLLNVSLRKYLQLNNSIQYVFEVLRFPIPMISFSTDRFQARHLRSPSPGFRRILQFACTLASLPVLASGNRPTKWALRYLNFVTVF